MLLAALLRLRLVLVRVLARALWLLSLVAHLVLAQLVTAACRNSLAALLHPLMALVALRKSLVVLVLAPVQAVRSRSHLALPALLAWLELLQSLSVQLRLAMVLR
jgi:hypothetical protein